MKFSQKSAFILFCILMDAGKCIATEEIANDDRILSIPDIYLIKATADSYKLSLNVADELMLYARSNLAYKQCMAIYLDTYNAPYKAEFMAIFQSASTPGYVASKVYKKTVKSSGTDTLIQTTSSRLNKAIPVCSICKYEENDNVFLGSLSITYPDQESSEFFVFSPIISDTHQYSVNFNSRYYDNN